MNQQRGEGGNLVNPDGVVVHLLIFGNVRLNYAGHGRIHSEVDRKDDIVSGKGVAIVPLNILPQMESYRHTIC
ncbi:hypothetical protein SDC9_189879 [bioreactor metagenome]|uniref:Uncharacterized protein n=1 Tax=bioreactor metagenome TaxID=1076179 RepID=A0A645HV25_9ZZZZ